MKSLEVALWACGTALMVFFAGAQGWGEWARQRAVDTFIEAHQPAQPQRPAGELPASDRPTTRDRPASDDAPVAVPAGPAAPVGPPLPPPLPARGAVIALLRIPAIGLEVPVSYGTGVLALGRGAGLVEGTALPGEPGNVAIAAHRDSYFRGLARLALGDLIEVDSPQGRLAYHVTGLSVVEPADVYVLADTGEPVLTLVTCYPFHFVGNAPQRFIVRAAAGLPAA
jgi:sortase A